MASHNWFLYWDSEDNLWVFGDHINYGLRLYKAKKDGTFDSITFSKDEKTMPAVPKDVLDNMSDTLRGKYVSISIKS